MAKIDDLLAHFKQQNDMLSPMIKPEDIQGDFKQAPMSEDQKGEQAGVQAVNQAAPVANQALQEGQRFVNQQQNTPLNPEQFGALTEQQRQDMVSGRSPQSVPQLDNIFSSGAPVMQNNSADFVSLRDNPNGQLVSSLPPVPGISSAKPVNQEETKQAIKSANDLQAQNESDIKGAGTYYEAMKQGLQAERTGEANLANQTAEDYAKVAQGQQAYMAQQQAKADEQANNLKGELSQMIDVDPNRIWSNDNVGGKFGFLISAMYGGLETGKPLSNLIQNDINAQVKDIQTHHEKANNFVALLEKYTGNTAEAAKMATSTYELMIKAHQTAMAMGIKADPAVVQKDALNYVVDYSNGQKKLAIETMGKQAELGKNQTEASQKDVENKLGVEKARIDRIKEMVGMATLSPEEGDKAERVANMAGSLSRMDDLKRKGFDPTKTANFTLLRHLADPSFKGNAIAEAAQLAMSDSQKQQAIDYYNNVAGYVRQKALEEGSKRGQAVSEDQIKQMIGSYVNDKTSLNRLQLERENDIRNAIGVAGPKVISKLYTEFPDMKKFLIRRTQGLSK